ncbi:MAG: hypothetical protein AABZ01_13025, partial [Gemmatimonadota bacterium]
MVLSYSRRLYIEFTVSQEMEDFLRGHVNAFAEEGASREALAARVRILGGLSPPLTTVVLRTGGREIRLTGALQALGAVTEFAPWRWRILDDAGRWRL